MTGTIMIDAMGRNRYLEGIYPTEPLLRHSLPKTWTREVPMTQSSVRYLGSRELHRELPRILDELSDQESRLVLTIHAKPKAVILGADAFATLVRQVGEVDRQLGEELSALLNNGIGKRQIENKPASARNGRAPRRQERKLEKSTRSVRAKAD